VNLAQNSRFIISGSGDQPIFFWYSGLYVRKSYRHNCMQGRVTPTPTDAAVSAARKPVAVSKPVLTFVPPRPVKTVLPNLALLDRSLVAGIRRIQVEVDIDESGRVVAARPLESRPGCQLSAYVGCPFGGQAMGIRSSPTGREKCCRPACDCFPFSPDLEVPEGIS
jgi:hypothetical protein